MKLYEESQDGGSMHTGIQPRLTTVASWQWQGHEICYWMAEPEDGAITAAPVVLLHGFGASAGHWRKNIARLAQGRRVYALDWLGFGASAKPLLAYNLQLWEQQLADFCLEVVGERAVLVGNSIGALVSLMVSAHHADLVCAAVLINCAGGLSHRPNELPPLVRPIMGAMQMILRIPGLAETFFEYARSRRNIRNTLKRVYVNHDAVSDELVELLYQPSTTPGAAKVFVSVLTADAGPSPEELLPEVRCPLLILWGENDPWTPIARGREFTHHAPGAEFTPLAGLGHCPHDEDPERVNRLILEWLARQGR